MKKSMLTMICLSVILIITSCTSMIDYGTDINQQQLTAGSGKSVANINTKLTGLYFLGLLPIVCGDPDKPGDSTFFSDKVTVDNAVNMLTKEASKIGATKTLNIQSEQNSHTLVLTLWLFSYVTAQASGNAIR